MIGEGHAHWVMQEETILAAIAHVDTTVLTIALVDLIPGGI